MDMDSQFITIYGKFVTSQTASFSRGDINLPPQQKITNVSSWKNLDPTTNLPYMDINWQSISIYGYVVTSLTAYYSCADIKNGILSQVHHLITEATYIWTPMNTHPYNYPTTNSNISASRYTQLALLLVSQSQGKVSEIFKFQSIMK